MRRRRNAAETDPLMTALGLPYPTIIGIGRGRRVGVDASSTGSWPRAATACGSARRRRDAERDLRACIDGANEADPFLRDHPATVEITGGRFSSARVPADHPLAGRASPVASRRSPADAPGCIGEPYGADMRAARPRGRHADA